MSFRRKAPNIKPAFCLLLAIFVLFGLISVSIEASKPISRGHLNDFDYEDENYIEYESTVLPRKYHSNLPNHFDARYNWPKCARTIGHISQQGDCGSCWAVATADVISDRLCIESQGNIRTRISARDLMDYASDGGCNGEDEVNALMHFIKNGLVTEQCKPYPSVLSRRFGYRWHILHKQTLVRKYSNHNWKELCTNPRVDYLSDLYYGKSFRKLQPNNELVIREEIYQNGSVLASLIMDDGLIDNWDNSQVYSCEFSGKASHAVRIIGWGMAKGRGEFVPYWLVVNSWGRHWGQGGTFKVARGNELGCLIEREVYSIYL